EKKEIEIINSNFIRTTAELGPNIKVLVGQVALHHDSTTMYCDSALYNIELKLIDAFGDIEIQRLHNWDTIYLFGDTLHYNGNTKIAKVRQNVKLLQDTIQLTTDFLDYDLNKKVGTYHNGGRIISGTDTLISKNGYFYSNTKDVFFKTNVQVYSNRAKIFTDTLKHNISSRISYLLGPSEIYSDSNRIYAEFGRYDYNQNRAYLSGRSQIETGEHIIIADSLYYDRDAGYGLGFKNVMIIDTIQNIILKGNYGEFYEDAQLSMMTDSAVFIEIDTPDTLWLHSDTILSYVDTLFDEADTLAFRMVFAYNHVKLYKQDLQLKCDSLVYTQLDSLLMLFGDPIIWSEESQLNAMYIQLFMSKNSPKEMFMFDSAYVSEKVDSMKFNTIKSNFVHVWFKQNTVDKIHVKGNVNATYYMIEDSDSSDIGLGVLHCDSMNIFLEDSKIDLLVPYNEPVGNVYPPDDIPSEKKSVSGFIWLDMYRPKNKDDIFIWKEKKTSENNDIDETKDDIEENLIEENDNFE
ncbi:MAG: OstA-like protein, partial [Candidatus Cloacimonadota bacterium]|nr:OstA-like protein [Candidatus Cloacimonadota bacterium]